MTTVPNTNGIDLTSLDLYAIAVNTGFGTEANGNNPLGMPDAVIATAIAMGENGNRTSGILSNVLNPNADTGDYSIGPWQINLRIGANNTVVGSRGGFTAEQLTNPFNNAVVAKALHDGRGNWTDWTAFTGGNVWKNLGPASAAAVSLSLPDGQMEKQLASIQDRLNSAHAVLPGTQGGSGAGGGGNYTGSPLPQPGSGGTISPPASTAKLDLNGSIVVIAGILLIIVGGLVWKGGDLVRVGGPSLKAQIGPKARVGVLT